MHPIPHMGPTLYHTGGVQPYTTRGVQRYTIYHTTLYHTGVQPYILYLTKHPVSIWLWLYSKHWINDKIFILYFYGRYMKLTPYTTI